jgi:type VI protein secretion system component VasK
MALAFKRIRVYFRLTLLGIVAVLVAVILIKNRNNAVAFWFFGLTNEQEKVNVVWLMVCTAAATLVVWWVLSLGWRLWRDMRELRRLEESKRVKDAQDKRERELQQREKRIDEKVQEAIERETDAP